MPLYYGINEEPFTQILRAKTEVSKYYGLQVRAQFQTESGVYLFAAPSYSKLEIKISPDTYAAFGSSSPSFRLDDWMLGIGAGVGMKFTDSTSAEFSYEKTEFIKSDSEIMNIQLRFAF